MEISTGIAVIAIIISIWSIYSTISTGIAVIAIIISIWSIYSTKRLWFLEHRPIVIAEIVEHSSGMGVATFNLVIYNSGNRPATNIFLESPKVEIDKIVSKGANERHKQEIVEIFSRKSTIPLLVDGTNILTAFFSFSNILGSNEDILEYGKTLPIVIHYSDIEGNKYKSSQVIFIKGAKGFGGSVWVNN